MFYATHAAFLNDPSENKLSLEALKSLGITESILELCEVLPGTPYVISFCKTDNNLPMWRLYGGNACGVALGFDEKEIVKHYKTEGNTALIIHDKCQYTTAKQLRLMIRHSKEYQEWESDCAKRKNLLPIARIMLKSLMYKHKAYEFEDEYRLGFKDVSPREFRNNANGVLIPYKSMPIPITSLKTITIGPCANREKIKYTIQLLFQSKSCLKKIMNNSQNDEFIHYAEIPYTNKY